MKYVEKSHLANGKGFLYNKIESKEKQNGVKMRDESERGGHMKRMWILGALLCAVLLCGCGAAKAAESPAPQPALCMLEGCDQPAAAEEGSDYCVDHAGECEVCGKRIPLGQTLCEQCVIDHLDQMEPTHSQSDIAAFG